jgi:hypothetical protein
MANKQLMLPANRAFGTLGAPMPLATLHLYETGGLEPALFYADSDLSVSLGSMLTADGAGYFPISYQNEDTPFRLIMKDDEGAELEDIDPFYFGLSASHIVPAPAVTSIDDLQTIEATDGLLRWLDVSNRFGVFRFSDEDLSAEVAADTLQGVYIAPDSDLTGASGAWIRTDDGAARPEWFGAIGDATTDDAIALQAWLDYGGDLFLPAKTYRSSATLVVRTLVHIRGTGSEWAADELGSVLKFDAGVAGLDVQPETPLLTWGNPATQDGAFGSTFRDFALLGQGGAAATGFYNRTYIHAENVNVWSFSGKAWDWSASGDFSDGNSEYGNLSNSSMMNCGGYACGSHALHIRGRDANTCTIQNFTFFGCGGWGILNESIISNNFIKPQGAGCTLGAIKVPGSTGCTFVLPFIESDSNNNCEINSNSVVIGYDLNSQNNTTLTCLSVEPKFHKTELLGFSAPEALASERSLVYKWDGLWLQGRGSLKDVTLANRDGSIAAWVPTNSIDFKVTGTSFGNVFQTNGTNTAWPGVADGYGALHSHVDNGFSLGGYGGTYDTSLRNRNGTIAMGVLANSVNVSFAGTGAFTGALSALNLSGTNTGDQTSIVGITGSLAEFNAALTGADFATGGGTATGTNTGDQASIVGITGSLAEFNAALTGADFATGGGTVTGTSSGTNTGDQASIVGITGSLAEFNAALVGADFATGGGTATGTNTGDQTSIVGITGTVAQFNAAITDGDLATGGGTATGTNTGDQTSIVGITGTVAQFNTAITDGDLATGGGTATGTNTGDQTSIVGITGTKAQFNTAVSDGDVAFLDAAAFSADITVPDEIYGAGWNGSFEVPTKNALYDKIESIAAGNLADGDYGDVAVSGSGSVMTVEGAAGNFTAVGDLNADNVRATGSGIPTSGAGITMYYTGSSGYFEAYDWGTAQYKGVNFNGSQVLFQISGVTKITTTSTETTFVNDVLVPDEAYASGWNGDLSVPTKNAVYDKIETLVEARTASGAAPATGAANQNPAPSYTTVLNTADNAVTTVETVMNVTDILAGTYFFEYFIVWRSGNTGTGCQFNVDYSGTVTRMRATRHYQSTGAAAATGVSDGVAATLTGNLVEHMSTNSDNGALGPNTGVGSTTEDQFDHIRGIMVVSDGGTLSLTMTGEGNGAVTFMADSFVQLTRLA